MAATPMMSAAAFTFQRERFGELLARRRLPERTNGHSAVMLDYLAAHIWEYDTVEFSVRVGDGIDPNPDDLPGVQATAVHSSRKRIDMVLWAGQRATIVEAKVRIGPDTLGQLRTYAHLWEREHPDAVPPRVIAIGRTSDRDTQRVLSAEGVDVYLYEANATGPGADAGGV